MWGGKNSKLISTELSKYDGIFGIILNQISFLSKSRLIGWIDSYLSRKGHQPTLKLKLTQSSPTVLEQNKTGLGLLKYVCYLFSNK